MFGIAVCRQRAGLKPPRSQNEAGWKPAETSPRRVDEGLLALLAAFLSSDLDHPRPVAADCSRAKAGDTPGLGGQGPEGRNHRSCYRRYRGSSAFGRVVSSSNVNRDGDRPDQRAKLPCLSSPDRSEFWLASRVWRRLVLGTRSAGGRGLCRKPGSASSKRHALARPGTRGGAQPP